MKNKIKTFPFEILGKDKPYIGSEDKFQKATADLMRLKYRTLYEDAFHVPNGGARNRVVGAKLKGQGLKRGVSDWIILQPRGKYHGLIIELKRSTGRLSPEQIDFLTTKANKLYLCFVIYNADAFEEVIQSYLYLDADY